jgi:hypothetical protein
LVLLIVYFALDVDDVFLHQLSQAIIWLTHNYTSPLREKDLAADADFRAAVFVVIRAQDVGVGLEYTKQFGQFFVTFRESPAMLRVSLPGISRFPVMARRIALARRTGW